MKLCYRFRYGDAICHVKIKTKTTVLNMLKRLDKIRFRGQRPDVFLDLGESPNTSDTECSEEILMKPKPLLKIKDTEELQDPVSAPAGLGTLAMAAAIQDYQRTETDGLNEVKGHLEIALLEKHFLQEELRKLREETNIETLKQELEKERSKRLDLEQKLNLEVLKTRCKIKVTSEDEDQVGECGDVMSTTKESLWNLKRQFQKKGTRPEDSAPQPPRTTPAAPTGNSTDKQKETMYSWLQTWLYDRFGAYIEDFRFQPEVNTAEPDEPLSAKRLTENMRRLKRGAKPVTNFKRNLFALSSWHSVYTSTFAFIIYMNAAWHGWAIPLFLFLAILRLSLNYLISRGWRIQWSIVPEISEPADPPKEDLTVSEKFQLVLDVAQKAQNLFGKMADVLEKIKNLFMWVHPEITQKLYIGLWVAFICSCLLPYKLMGFMMGLYAGIKFFIIDFLFRSCPKLRDKYDTPHIIWTSLPTDPQLKERGGATLSRRLSGYEKIQPAVARGSLGTGLACGISLEEQTGRVYNTKKGSFHEVFNLSEDERPLAVCENGWRCCLINRDRKSPTDYIRNGVLFVTENYLCFESSSSRSNSSKKNKVIKLIDITDIQKYKVLSVLPGSGMGISIATPSTQKPLVFGAMIHRDEAFDAIFTQYMKTATMTTAINPET
ncbi:GRAM domain-containing protein 4 isoform X3 [Salmo salar]|uniref:GRAM domain-containing protein 4 isoform X3 n=1 Tax=Salmo salar TaxID=8030 RepID=A0A1S3PCZ0_SALSA|nr:GRAM domain-containing protein 4 isoform X3 [Salmo salar]|eukprot:XP_014025548.1 PREDICTED: GRAM domain-containing protein 4 isoform X1 [Salmo salar]